MYRQNSDLFYKTNENGYSYYNVFLHKYCIKVLKPEIVYCSDYWIKICVVSVFIIILQNE